MDNIDYNQPGGLGLSTQILDAGQEAYRIFNAFGNMAGDLAIITGCEVGGGGYVAPGFVSVYGELLPFQGGQLSDKVAIVETSDLRVFEDGSLKPVIYTRYVAFGEATVSYPFANFRRPMTLFQIEDRLNLLMKANPPGTVKVWGRPAEEIPEYHEPYLPLQGKVPVGHLPGHPIFGNLGSSVGAESVTLTANQLPILSGTFQTLEASSFGNSGIVTTQSNDNAANIGGGGSPPYTHKTKKISFGGGQSMTNIQPSTIVDFIIFLGFD